MSQIRWLKCPNDLIVCITECGKHMPWHRQSRLYSTFLRLCKDMNRKQAGDSFVHWCDIMVFSYDIGSTNNSMAHASK